mgnify:CR=1 FL=1
MNRLGWEFLVKQSHTERTIESVDVAVIGGTPGGIAAALAAARAGFRVALTEYHPHLGGMATSGLGKSDNENRDMIGGIFTEFVRRVWTYYADTYGRDSVNAVLCNDGYYYEPSVAERIFNEMLAGQRTRIQVFPAHRLVSVRTAKNCVHQATLLSRASNSLLELNAKVFIDATYEGDLYAMAGAEYRLGRESRDEYGELHAGVVYYDYEERLFLPGTTGEADRHLPAYTYRLCLTTDPKNSIALDSPPPEYDRQLYLPYLQDLRADRLSAPKRLVEGWGYYPKHFGTLLRAFSVTELPNGKIDANINPRPLAFLFSEENDGYADGDWDARERICLRHRHLTLGLLYFLQNDHAVPLAQREMARQYGLPKDEFADNGHFPFQLYVREARRLVGEYTLTEHDVTSKEGIATTAYHEDSIAAGEFPVDSFPCRKCQPGDTRVLEGYLCMLDHITRPYGIPYRIMIPRTIDGLIVPVAASATHVAYSSIRMEPTWMAMGQAAGTAAAVAIERACSPRSVPITRLRQILRADGQVLEPLSSGARTTIRMSAPQMVNVERPKAAEGIRNTSVARE